MSTLKIAQLGEPVLNQTAQPVLDIFHPQIQQLILQLKQAMTQANGVGIAAPQLFASSCIIVVASRPNPRYPDAPEMTPLVMINPKILAHFGPLQQDWEGCLSIVDKRAEIARHSGVEVSWYCEHGHAHHGRFDGFVARIIQHEMDHLEGLTLKDRLLEGCSMINESEWLAQSV